MEREPTMTEETLCTQIALGWALALLVLGWMFSVMITQSALANDGFHELHRDPGLEGLPSVIYMVPFYALMPIYVYLVRFRTRALRWLAVAAAGFKFLMWILHHLWHWYHGTRPDATSHVIDITLHLVGLWVLVKSIQWAKLPPPAREMNKHSVTEEVVSFIVALAVLLVMAVLSTG
jgi:hypothetical protein